MAAGTALRTHLQSMRWSRRAEGRYNTTVQLGPEHPLSPVLARCRAHTRPARLLYALLLLEYKLSLTEVCLERREDGRPEKARAMRSRANHQSIVHGHGYRYESAQCAQWTSVSNCPQRAFTGRVQQPPKWFKGSKGLSPLMNRYDKHFKHCLKHLAIA